jgi:hypothetical protein
MWLAVVETKTGTIPAIDCPVVDAQRLQRRHLSFLQHDQGIFLQSSSEKDTKPGQIFLEQFNHRLLDPAGAKAHAW